MYRQRTSCAICNHSPLDQVIDLPKLPLTGLYIPPSTPFESLPDYVRNGIDQGFLFCSSCGHGQLLNVIESKYIYDDTYTHRGSKSPIATGGNDYFVEFLKKIAGEKKFKRAVDIGCNDLYLVKKLEPLASRIAGVDPIWKNQDHQLSEKIHVLGGFVEEVDIEKALSGKPDLVVSAHTFEHIEDPKTVLKNVVNNSDPDALFIIEIPSFDNLLRNYRFDQIFHQHIHYYSLSSFCRLIQELNCAYIAHDYNYSMWGGTMLVAFKKGAYTQPPVEKPQLEEISKGYKFFKEQLKYALKGLQYRASKERYGYGAAQMLPILAYHMESDFSFMNAILDDNPSRWNHTYPSLKCVIAPPPSDLNNADVLLTALDSARPILKKLSKTNAQRVILPLNIC